MEAYLSMRATKLTYSIFSLTCLFILSCNGDTYPPEYPIGMKAFGMDIPVFSQDVLLDTWEPFVLSLAGNDIIIFALNQHGVRACDNCGDDPIIYRKTSDNGASWKQIGESENTWSYINDAPLTWFADIVAVRDYSNNAYITYIGYTSQPPPHPWNILFQKSLDQGDSWSAPVVVSGNISADKNWMCVNQNIPEEIYVTFNSQYPFSVSSKDGGETWSDPVLMEALEGSYFFAGGGGVRPTDGTVFFAYSAIPTGGDDEEWEEEESYYSYDQGFDTSNSTANFTYARVFSSADQGSTWKVHNISAWKDTQKCPESAECGNDFLSGSSALSIGPTDSTVYYSYNGDDLSTEEVEMRAMFTRLAVDDDDFVPPFDISDAPRDEGVFHSFMFLAAGSAACDIRAAWMDNRTGAWNVWYRESTDCGNTFSSPSVRVSWSYNDAFSFQSPDGFTFPYGDYGAMTVDSDDNTHIVWGEGLGWYAGGTVMYATQASSTIKASSDDDDSAALSDVEVLTLAVVCTAVGSAIIGAVGTLFAVRAFGNSEKLLQSNSKAKSEL